MSNGELNVLVLTLLFVHLAVLAQALFWRQARPWWLRLNTVEAACALGWLANHHWYYPPADALVLGWAGFELAALAVSIIAGLRPTRVWMAAAWTAFGVHGLAIGLAALFALTFKMTRLF